MTTPGQFEEWLSHPEGRRIEFKAAAGSFRFEELVKYCVALANEGGGTIILSRSQIQVLLRELVRRNHPGGSLVPRNRSGGLQPDDGTRAMTERCRALEKRVGSSFPTTYAFGGIATELLLGCILFRERWRGAL